MTPPEELLALKPWPLNGYAPGKYLCKCHECGERFEGDKRAVTCLECAVLLSKRAARAPSIGDADKQAVAWQQRYKKPISGLNEWHPSTKEAFDKAPVDMWEFRALYTHPAPPADKQADGLEPALAILARCKRSVSPVHDVHVLTTTEAETIATALTASKAKYREQCKYTAAAERERDDARLRVAELNEKWIAEADADEFVRSALEAAEAKVLALTTRVGDAESDALRLHGDKMRLLDALIVISVDERIPPWIRDLARAALEQASKAGGGR